MDSTVGDLYVAERRSGRVRRANWKTKELGDWVTLGTSGCNPLDPHIWQVVPMRSRPYVVVQNCFHVEVLDNESLLPARTIEAADTFEIFSFDVSPDESRILVTSRKSRDVWTTRLYDTSSWEMVREWPIENAQFVPDGQHLASELALRTNPKSADYDLCGVAFIDVKTGSKTSQWTKPMSGICPQRPFFFPNGQPSHMISDDFFGSAVSEWDLKNGALLRHLPSNVGPGGPAPNTESMSLSSDGKFVAVVRARFEWYAEYGLTIWNLQTGKSVYELPLGQQSDAVRRVRFSSNGRHVAFVHSDRVEIFEYGLPSGPQ